MAAIAFATLMLSTFVFVALGTPIALLAGVALAFSLAFTGRPRTLVPPYLRDYDGSAGLPPAMRRSTGD